MQRVALYLRKSREDEVARDETLAKHETMLTDYCKRHNLNIDKIYREVVSGEKIANRPQMQQLLEDVSNGLYNGVVCVEIERLSRGNPADQCEILEVFKSSNTVIYTLNKTYDLSKDEIDEEYFEFALFMSRREYKTITRRLQRGRMQSTKEGYFIGSVTPYGFTKVKTDKGFILTPEPTEAAIVKTVYDMYLNGVGYTDICRYLNDKGIRTRFGKKFQYQTISDIFNNRCYIGEIYSSKLNKWVDGKHSGIISNEDFERVQKLKEQRRPKLRKSYEIKNPLATLVKCGKCGYTMKRNRSKNPKNEYLCCRSSGCTNQPTRIDTLENAVLEALRAELANFNEILLDYDDKASKDRIKRENELKILNCELQQKEEMLTTACEMLEKGIYTIELFKNRTESIKQAIHSIEQRISELNAETNQTEDNIRSAIPILNKVLEEYHNLEVKEKNIILKSIVKSIVYTKVDDEINLDIVLLV